MAGGVAPGWYPDYEAPPGHQRFWDGTRWTERRSAAPVAAAPPARTTSTGARSYAPWVLAAVGVLVAISATVLVLGDDHEAESSPPSAPGPAGTPGPPASELTTQDAAPQRRTWQVVAVVDGDTVRLADGVEVRLVGLADSCGSDELARLVVGQRVTLTRRGPDKDATGRLLRYVERDGLDVGKRLIQKGWARASDEPNARRAIYRRVDARSPDAC